MKRANYNERGALGGVEGLAFGVLIFVMGTLMLTSTWAVVDAKLATTAAAREATRAYVEAPSEPQAHDAAEFAAHQAAVGHGYGGPDVAVAVDGGGFRRCGVVEVAVSLQVQRLSLPLIGGNGGVTTLTSRHTEVIDPYRSGLTGTADC